MTTHTYTRTVLLLLLTLGLSACGKQPEDAFSEPSAAAPTTTEVAATEPTTTPEPTTVATEQMLYASLKITKFSDYSCAVCRSASEVLFSLQQEIGEDALDINLVNYNIYPQSRSVALVSECVREQGLQQAFHKAYYEQSFGKVSEAEALAVAESVGADVPQLEECLSTDRPTAALEAGRELATELGVTGTPYFLINDTQLIPGFPRSRAQFKQMLLDARVPASSS